MSFLDAVDISYVPTLELNALYVFQRLYVLLDSPNGGNEDEYYYFGVLPITLANLI